MCAALNPAQETSRFHALRTAAGAGRCGDRQDARRDVPHCGTDSARHRSGADSGRHVHQQGGGRNAGTRGANCWETRHKSRPQVSTFHAHCVKILRRHIRRLGYPERFAIYDRGDQESIARSVLREIRVASETLRPGDLLYHISGWKSHCVRPAAGGRRPRPTKNIWRPWPIAAINRL